MIWTSVVVIIVCLVVLSSSISVLYIPRERMESEYIGQNTIMYNNSNSIIGNLSFYKRYNDVDTMYLKTELDLPILSESDQYTVHLRNESGKLYLLGMLEDRKDDKYVFEYDGKGTGSDDEYTDAVDVVVLQNGSQMVATGSILV